MRANLVTPLFVAALLGCGPLPNVVGDGSLATEDREVTGVARVRLALPASLTIKLGQPARLHLEGEANLLPLVASKVHDGLLIIDVDDGVAVTPTRPIHLELTVPALRGLESTSLGDIAAPALSTATTFTVDLSSRGSISIASLDADRLETRVSSSGSLRIDGGNVWHHELTLSSRGNVTATTLRSATARAVLTSSGSAWLWVTAALEARLTSSGSVRYLGSPTLAVEDSGSGSVEPMSSAFSGP